MKSTDPKNPHIGSNVGDYFRERRSASPSFDAIVQSKFDFLQLARHIRELRSQAKISQEQLATMVGTKQPAIARLEKGEVTAKLDLLQKVAMALGMKLEIKLVPGPNR